MKITNENINNKEILDLKLKITNNKGFHITFENGWTISVQFGWGNYCDNYNNPVEEASQIGKYAYASNTAEVWAWKGKKILPNNTYPKDPLSYQSPEQILKFINKIARKKK